VKLNQRGMTLVEVVVASVVFSLIMLGAITAMRTFGLTLDRLDTETASTGRFREVSRFLRQALRDAVPGDGYYAGNASRMVWLAPMDRVGSAAGLQFLRLTRQGDRLQLSFSPFDLGVTDPARIEWGRAIDDFTLLEGLDALTVTYRNGAGMAWAPSPVAAEGGGYQLPQAVKVEVGMEGRRWPPIVVALDGYVQR